MNKDDGLGATRSVVQAILSAVGKRTNSRGVIALLISILAASFSSQSVAVDRDASSATVRPPEQTSLSSASAPPATVPELIKSLTYLGSGAAPDVTRKNLPPQINDQIIWSPDGRLVAVVTYRGDLARNQNEYTLRLFKAENLLSKPEAEVIATLSSSSLRPAIQNVRWMNPQTLAFLGEMPGELPQVYAVDIVSRQLSRRTQATATILSFDISSDGSVVVYATEGAPDLTLQTNRKQKGFALPDDASLPVLLAGRFDDPSIISKKSLDLWILRVGSAGSRYNPPCRQFGVDMRGAVRPNVFMVSPRGDQLLLRCAPEKVVDNWSRYRANDPSFDAQRAQQWLSVNLQTKAVRPLIDAPIPPSGEQTLFGYGPTYDGKVFWSPDGRSVIVANAWLPLTKASERLQTPSPLFSVEVDLATGALTEVTRVNGDDDGWTRVQFWNPATDTITLEEPQRRMLRKADGRWIQDTVEDASPILAIEQGLNSPPRIVATNPKTGRKDTVLDPTPDLFSKQHFGIVTLLKEWNHAGGRRTYATLYWPPNYESGKRYPVVFQAHGGTSDKFRPYGDLERRQAAQPLVNAGIFVVQYSEGAPGWDQLDFSTYGPTLFAQLEDLIDLLDRSGLIDRTLVGVSGASTDYAVFLQFMSHSRYPVVAATLAEGATFSYADYLFKLVGSPWRQSWEKFNGGLPWGSGRRTWLERAPGFNMERINAAVQFEACLSEEGDFPGQYMTPLVGMWEHYSGLRLLGRPTELVLLPEAQHLNLNKPWMKFKSQQSAVDWLRFWLQGYERTNVCAECQESQTELREQFKRWRVMRQSRS